MSRSLNPRKLTRRLTVVLSFVLASGAALSWQFVGGPRTTAHAAPAAARAAAAAPWTRTGPHSGTVTAMAVSQSSPATVYAHVSASGKYYNYTPTGFFRSTDGGAHWTRMGYPALPVFPHRFLSLAVDPTNADVVYAGTVRSGIYKTTDGGATWAGPYGLQESEVVAIAIDPSNTSKLYASFFSRGLYKSVDGGVTWAYASEGNGPGFGTRAIRIDPSNPSVIYTAGGDSGVYRSTDSGVHWTLRNTGLPSATVVDLALDPSNPSTLYVGTSKGVFKSVDGAANWSASSNGLPLGAGHPQGTPSFYIAINPANPSHLYAISYYYGTGVYQSADGGATWTLAGAASTRFYLVAVSADGQNVFAGTFGGGMFRSASGGPWAEANEGMPYAAVRNIATDPNDPTRLYVGSGDNVYRSVDRGQSWAPSGLPPHERPIIGLVVDPSEPATVYAAPDYVGVLKSADGGLNWTQVIDAGNINVLALAIAPSPPHNLYFSTLSTRVHRGAPGGETWTRISSQPGLVTAFAADPSNSSVVYAAGFNLYKSTNSGTSWSGLFAYDMSTVSQVNGILVHPSNPSTLYIHSSGSASPVRRSTDGGATWNDASAGLPATGASGSYNVSALVFDPVNPSVLYAACYGTAEAGGGVYRSIDGGASWGAFNGALAGVNALAFDLSGRTLYAGADDGLYKVAADAAPVTFSTDLFAAAESAGTATVTVTRASGAGAATVNYAASGGTAAAGVDYAATSGSLNFAEGETSKTFSVTLLDDATDEFDEAVRLTLTSADGSTVLARASLVISDDDSPPALTVSDVSAPEGDFDNTEFVFHVTLSAPSAKTVTASVNNAGGTAVSGGNDLFAYGGPYNLKFAPGETDKTVMILVRGDLTIEPDEDFFVNVTGVVNANPADPQGRGLILNDDATPTVSLSVNDVTLVEGNYGLADAVFDVTLSGPTAKTVKVDYSAFTGGGTEHTGTGGTLTFAPGEVSKSFTTRVIGDTRYESDEQFLVTLSLPRNALIADGSGLLTIVNDEAPPTMSVNDVTVREGNSGDRVVTFVVTLSSAVETQATFSYETVAGTATQLGPTGTVTGLEDYGWVSGAIIIPPGQTKRAVNVNVKGDTRAEPNETFTLKISDSLNGVAIADGEGSCVIVDDDGAVEPAFLFGPAEYRVTEGEGEVTVTVLRAGDLSAPASVNYATRAGAGPRSASDRSDYTAAAGTLRFAAGEESKTFKVLVTDDALAERVANSDEFIELVLSDPAGGVAPGSPQPAVITIVDDDLLDGVRNPIDGAGMFVRQHYHDFLNRQPDASGFNFWTGEINGCGFDAGCVEVKRVNVSAAFFLSIEFQETGYLVYRMYKAGYGDAASPNVEGTVPVVRIKEFLADTQQIGQGVQVNVGNWQQQLEANKQAYALEFVGRPRFLADFPASMTAAEFVAKLDQNAGQVLSAEGRAQLESLLGQTPADASKRAAVLRLVAENPTLSQREFNRAFVLMQYFGYLRRNPDDAPDADFRGWKFWLDKLNEFGGNYVQAEMVKAFISSDEYRKRFAK